MISLCLRTGVFDANAPPPPPPHVVMKRSALDQLEWRFEGFSGRAVVKACELAHAHAVAYGSALEPQMLDHVLAVSSIPPRSTVESATAIAEANGELEIPTSVRRGLGVGRPPEATQPAFGAGKAMARPRPGTGSSHSAGVSAAEEDWHERFICDHVAPEDGDGNGALQWLRRVGLSYVPLQRSIIDAACAEQRAADVSPVSKTRRHDRAATTFSPGSWYDEADD